MKLRSNVEFNPIGHFKSMKSFAAKHKWPLKESKELEFVIKGLEKTQNKLQNH